MALSPTSSREQGDAAVQRGDTVLAGEVLISGTVTMEPPAATCPPPTITVTHARGTGVGPDLANADGTDPPGGEHQSI